MVRVKGLVVASRHPPAQRRAQLQRREVQPGVYREAKTLQRRRGQVEQGQEIRRARYLLGDVGHCKSVNKNTPAHRLHREAYPRLQHQVHQRVHRQVYLVVCQREYHEVEHQGGGATALRKQLLQHARCRAHVEARSHQVELQVSRRRVAAAVLCDKNRAAVVRGRRVRLPAANSGPGREAPGAVPETFAPDQARARHGHQGKHQQLHDFTNVSHHLARNRHDDALQDLRAKEA